MHPIVLEYSLRYIPLGLAAKTITLARAMPGANSRMCAVRVSAEGVADRTDLGIKHCHSSCPTGAGLRDVFGIFGS